MQIYHQTRLNFSERGFLGVRALGCIAEQSFSVGEKRQAPVCSLEQLNMLSCRDRAMQHCQQAPVSNELSTAVLADSIALTGGKVIYSELQSPRGLSWSFASTASTSYVYILLTLFVLFIITF